MICRFHLPKSHKNANSMENGTDIDKEKVASRNARECQLRQVCSCHQRRHQHCRLLGCLKDVGKLPKAAIKKMAQQNDENEEKCVLEKSADDLGKFQVLKGVVLALQSKPGNYQQFW